MSAAEQLALPEYVELHKLTIEERFEAFMKAHPEFYVAFKRHALELILKGRRNYSADGIFHVIRFHSALRDSTGTYKVNNDFTRPMAERFHADYPEHAGFFRMRGGSK